MLYIHVYMTFQNHYVSTDIIHADIDLYYIGGHVLYQYSMFQGMTFPTAMYRYLSSGQVFCKLYLPGHILVIACTLD